MRAAVVTLVVMSGSAAAQTVPGTGGDIAREMLVEPSFVNSELPIGLPMRGGNPEDTVVLFDGFELPSLFHGFGVRSVLPFGSVDSLEILPGAFGVEYGRGSSVIALSSQRQGPRALAELTVLDASVSTRQGGFAPSARIGWNRLLDEFRSTDPAVFMDAIGRYDRRLTGTWSASLSSIASRDRARELYRVVAAVEHASTTWEARFAVSPLLASDTTGDRAALDTRVDIVRRANAAAGLTKLEWRLGQQTNSSGGFDSSLPWHTDVGAWSSIGANVSSGIRATAGLRVDSFDGDVATQPRAQIIGSVTSRLQLALGGGAYRRPPDQLAELANPALHPERATQVVAAGTYDDRNHLRIHGAAYYIDRRRLIVADSDGVLRNTGFGTSMGTELSTEWRDGPWRAQLSGALTSSKRFDYERAREHAAPFEQPVRLDALASWSSPRWILSGRFQLYSGLPYTPYTDAVYDSDTDTYEPLYVPPLSARTPLHHQVDLRIDYRFSTKHVGFDAFLDLHNAYGNRDAIEYRYSYDYRDRTAISALPIFPFAGLRVAL